MPFDDWDLPAELPPPQPRPRRPLRMTRRGLFRAAGLAAAGLVAYGMEQAYERVNSLLDAVSQGSEGSRQQRQQILNELLQRDLREPSEQNHAVLVAWLKFNGAEIKAHMDGLSISETSIRHFLYGRPDEGLDVSRELAARPEVADPHFLCSQMVTSFVSDAVTPYTLPRYDSAVLAPGTTTLQSTRSIGWTAPDFRTAFGNCQVNVDGAIHSSRLVRSFDDEQDPFVRQLITSLSDFGRPRALAALYPYQRVLVRHPRLEVADKYDFSVERSGTVFSLTLSQVAGLVAGREFGEYLAGQPFDLNGPVLAFDPNIDGPLLVQHGYARNYPLRASIQMRGEILIPVYGAQS